MKFKNRITFHESLMMINEITDAVFKFDEPTKTTSYLPELFDFAYRLAVAKYYGGYSMSGNTDTDYEAAMSINTEALIVDGMIDKAQLSGITDAVSRKIEQRNAEIDKSNITVVSEFDQLIPYLEKLMEEITAKVSAIDTKKLNKQLEKFNVKELVNAYMETEFARNQRNDLFDAKNAEIKQLKEELNPYSAGNAAATPIH